MMIQNIPSSEKGLNRLTRLFLAYSSKAIDAPELKEIEWSFVDCPGYQFWKDKSHD